MLSFSIEIPTTALAAHENPLCRAVLSNYSGRELQVPNPDLNPDWPRFSVENLDNGERREFTPQEMWEKHRVKPLPFDEGEGPLMRLAPGETRSWEFSLFHRIDPLPCGRYAVSAWCELEQGTVASDPLALQIRPLRPAAVRLAYDHGGFSRTMFVAWVNQEQPLQLHLRGLQISARIKPLQALRIAELPAMVTPVVSVCQNRKSTTSPSVAWLAGDELTVVDLGVDRVLGGPWTLRLPARPQLVLSPLWKDADSDATQALVWGDEPAGGWLQLLQIDDEVRPIGRADGLVPRPLWHHCCYFSDGSKAALLLAQEEGYLVLHRLDLDRGLIQLHPGLAGWDWELIGAAAQVDEADRVHGLIVGRDRGAEGERSVLCCRWSIAAEGSFRTSAARVWEPLAGLDCELLELRVDIAGNPHALVRRAGDEWLYVGEREGCRVEPPGRVETVGPPLLALMADGTIPLVLWHTPCAGVVGQPIGAAFPDFNGPDFVPPPWSEA